MNLIAQLNRFCHRFWRDESGVVLAFTVVVFLSLFVITCSVYAVGEHLRQRIELQNAADAAAYSAAVVQADTLSRIAAINKAMAWTYVQMGRSVMDYDVDVWLKATLDKFQADYAACREQISSYDDVIDTYGRSWIGSDLNSGGYELCQENGRIQINQSQSLPYSELYSRWAAAPHWDYLQGKIDGYRKSIIDMNQEEVALIADLQGNLQAVVTNVLGKDLGYPGPENYCFALLSNPASNYFALADEGRLLQFFDEPTDAAKAFPDGIDVWFNPQPGQGVQRRYQQAGSLRADWSWHLEGWKNTPKGPMLVFLVARSSDMVLGVSGEALHDPALYYQTEPVKAQNLTDTYFQPQGALVVGVARKATNPLSFLMADASRPGLYGFFSPPAPGGKPLYSWVAAAARAGYRDGEPGAYNTSAASQTTPGWLVSRLNLAQWDWDAELIPLSSTNGVSALGSLWESAPWQALFPGGPTAAGLGALSSGAAPDQNKALH